MVKYGLLDPMPLDNKEEEIKLKCELCGLEYSNQNEDEQDGYFDIDVYGRCTDCLQEWGEEYPDRV